MKKWIAIAAAAVLLAGGGYLLYEKLKPEPEPLMEAAPPITFEVTQETMTQTVQVKGKSVYTDAQDVSAPYAANIKKWHVKHGQQVNKGDALFTLETAALQSELQQIESDIERLKVEYEMNKVSLEQDSGGDTLGNSEEERKKAFAEREGKRLANELSLKTISLKEDELQRKREIVNKAVVRAPATGIFQLADAENKTSMVSEGQLVGSITNTSKIQFMTIVDEEDMFRLKKGMPVNVRMSAQKELSFTGKVSTVSKFARKSSDANLRQASQFDVVIDLAADPKLYGGVSLEGDIEILRKENVVAVSSLAILRDQEEPYVLIDKGNGQTEQVTVKTGIESGDKTEIISGLKPGDRVVLP